MAKNLEDIGIEAKVQTYDFSAWFDRVQKGDFDLSIGWSSQGATPYNFYRGVMSALTAKPVGELGAENWHRYSNEQADTLLTQYAATSNVEEQTAVVNQLQQLFVDNAPAIPLFPGPQWAEFNTMRFTDVPSAENPYVIPSTYQNTDRLVLITTIKPQPQ
jgi:peptide/nickel transport system substrate-binding protein